MAVFGINENLLDLMIQWFYENRTILIYILTLIIKVFKNNENNITNQEENDMENDSLNSDVSLVSMKMEEIEKFINNPTTYEKVLMNIIQEYLSHNQIEP